MSHSDAVYLYAVLILTWVLLILVALDARRLQKDFDWLYEADRRRNRACIDLVCRVNRRRRRLEVEVEKHRRKHFKRAYKNSPYNARVKDPQFIVGLLSDGFGFQGKAFRLDVCQRARQQPPIPLP